MPEQEFTPALGRFAPVRFYDLVVGSLMREGTWRGLAVEHAAPAADDVIVDVGCGTGSLALRLREAQPQARIVGIDPDPEVLAIAERKAAAAGAEIEWLNGMGDDLGDALRGGTASLAVSSLVLHQCPLAVKRSILASMFTALQPGGRLVIADYGLQRTVAMRIAFRGIQLADGFANTQPNADGALPELIAEAGFADVREADVVQTLTGSISIFLASRQLDD